MTTLPVTQTEQTQPLSLEVVANESGGALTPLPIDGTNREVNVSYDLVAGGPQVVSVSGLGSNGASTLYGVLQEVPMGVKAPTWLWLPSDNSTTNGLPLGLQRYTGEQSFDLVAVNASAAIYSSLIPLPWGGDAPSKIKLSPGMNNFLIPREQFLYSPFGQAILLGKNTSFNASRSLPLNDASERAMLNAFGCANLMKDLGAYWQNRAIASGPGNISGCTEQGVPAGNSLEVNVMAASSASSANTGGLPSDPSLYSTVGDPSALQSIVTLNITNASMLNLLLAGLIDNTTGGTNAVNGTLEAITYQVGSLGLNTAVVNALGNQIAPSDGLYKPPASSFPKKQPSSFWGAFWNAVTSFVTNPLGAILSLVNTVWDAARAAFTYLNHLATEAVAVGGEMVARAASVLVGVGEAILKALDQLLEYLLQLVTDLLKTVTQPIVNAMKSFAWSVESAAGRAQNDTTTNGSLASGDAGAFWSALSGPVFLFALGIGTVVVIALTILSGIDIGPSFVVDLLIGLLIGILAGLAIQALLSSVGSSFASLDSTAVYALESFFNGTYGTQGPIQGGGLRPLTGGGSAQPAWTTAALLLSTLVTFNLGFPITLFNLQKSEGGPAGAFVWAAVSLALAIVGITLFVVKLISPVPFAVLIVGIAVGIFALVKGGLELKSPATKADPPLRSLLAFVILLESVNVGSELYATVAVAT